MASSKMAFKLCLIFCIISTSTSYSYEDTQTSLFIAQARQCFPKDFLFGVATASYQTEGAWNTSGKSESIWDRYTHKFPDRVFDHNNGDTADDSYHLFRKDVKLMKDIGVQFYRFSVSWTRLLPSGFSNIVNPAGVRFYTELIDELHKFDIQPLVTMYHWDLPQTLQELGGWTNPLIADYFVDYARMLFKTFGHKVKSWITFNEPLTFCREGYGGDDAPGGRSSGLETYMCGHNVLRAHGMVYRMFEKEFKNNTGATVGISLDLAWMEPATTSVEDRNAAETARQFVFGWFANPIFSKKGDYPKVMRQRIDEISHRQHFPRSRLPKFTKEEIEFIKGSADFLGLNHYTTYLASKSSVRPNMEPSFDADMGVALTQKPDWPKTNSTWLKVVPWGFRKTLNWVKNTFDNPIVVITENGVSTEPGLRDTKRVKYIDSYLRSLLAAMKDGCNVLGYTHWSLLDNFEWMRGYSERFGLYEVDYTSPNKTRSPRLSATFYSKIVRSKCIPAQKKLIFKP